MTARKALALMMAASLLGAVGGAWAALPKQGAFSRVLSAEVQGIVFYADGETPAAEVPVRIWDIDQREFIYETETDRDGYFALPKLEPGKYYVTFDWMRLELEVVSTGELVQQPHDVIVIIPRGLGFMSINQLNLILMASTISEATLLYQGRYDRPPVVSP